MTALAGGLHKLERDAAAAVVLALLALVLLVAGAGRASATNAIVVGPEQDRIEITSLGVIYEGRGDSLQVDTAAGADGLVGRMSVNAVTPGTNPNWLVFALTNSTEKPVERWLSADRYTVIGSGAVWPDLDARRIEAVTPSLGFVPERVKSDRADLFRVTLEPGQTITYVAELSSDRLTRIYLWKPLDYELKIADRQLFNGIMLGLTGLMAIFLTAIFAANHKLVFPASALVAWVTLGYLCVDFGFFHKLFNLKPEANAVYRAAAEAALAASLVVFLHIFLRLALWHGLIRMLISVWLLFQFALIAVAIVDPRLAATFARLSFLGIGGVGACLITFLALRGQDRALSIVPTWILFLVWIFGASVALTGKLSGDMVVSGIIGGFVLILLIITFTVTQFAFRSVEPMYGAAPSELQLRSVAVDGAGAAVWEWNARRDEVKVSPQVESALGLGPGELNRRVEEFAKHLHPADRERFRLALWSVQERNDGKIRSDFRLRHADNSYRWFELEAAGIPGADPRSFKCVGLIRDVTDSKRAHERLLHDAVHDSLTGLPNRALLLDRLEVAIKLARAGTGQRPAIISIDIDKFRTLNSSVGLVLGDSLLLTVARRLQRHLGPNDTLARIGGDEFAILTLSAQPTSELAAEGERMRRSLRSPIKIAGQEIVVTASLGIAELEGAETHEDLLKRAETAMYRAKRAGADRLEVYRPDMKADRDEQIGVEAELRRAIEKGQVKVLYQPIVYLPTEELAGFEAIVRWEHPQLGIVNPAAVVPMAAESDLIVKLGSHVLMRAARDAASWQRDLPRPDAPLFVSVNVASRQLFRQDLIQEIRHILGRNLVPRGSLRLEVAEALVMDNPEQAAEILEWLRAAGAELALDEFGTGHCSLAYLERLPFDAIKIDRALLKVNGCGKTGEPVMVRSLVALAHELGRKVVAEGVESADDVGFLRSIGCEYGQGVFYGEPILDVEVADLLAMVRKSETKLKPRGLFKPKGKKKKSGKGAAVASEAGHTNGADAAVHAGGFNGTADGSHAAAARNGAGMPAPNGAGRTRPRIVPPLEFAPRPNHAQPAPPPAMAPLPPAPVPVAAQDRQEGSLLAAGPNPLTAGQPPVRPDLAMAREDAAALIAAMEAPLPPQPAMTRPSAAPPPIQPPVAERTQPTAPPPLPQAPAPAPRVAGPPPLPGAPPAAAAPQPPPPPVAQPALQPAPPAGTKVLGPMATRATPPPAPRPAAAAKPPPDFSQLPPAIAESLARLAGVPLPAKKTPEQSGV